MPVKAALHSPDPGTGAASVDVDRKAQTMTYGPVEMLVVKFPGNEFTGEIAPALAELIETGMIRVIDLLFVIKDKSGTIAVYEQDGWGDAVAAVFEPLVQPEDELFSRADAESAAILLEPNSSAAMLLFENTWAARFATAMANANGEVLVNVRVPREVIEQVVAESAFGMVG